MLRGEVRNTVSRWISQRSEGIKKVSSNTLKPRRGSGHWIEVEGAVDSPLEWDFGILAFRSLAFRQFRRQGVGALCVENPEVAKHDVSL
jgi:hypothetical protein